MANAPDPVDFRALGTTNIYEDVNVKWQGTRRGYNFPVGVQPYARSYKGEIKQTVELQLLLERALGIWSSGKQLHGWATVFGPRRSDGYPDILWNDNGNINTTIAKYWQTHFDLRHRLDRDWERGLGKKLQGKIKVSVGSMDAFQLNDAVYLLENALSDRTPPSLAEFRYGTSRGRGYSHAWSGDNTTMMRIVDLTLHQRLIPLLVAGFIERAPEGADLTSWRY